MSSRYCPYSILPRVLFPASLAWDDECSMESSRGASGDLWNPVLVLRCPPQYLLCPPQLSWPCQALAWRLSQGVCGTLSGFPCLHHSIAFLGQEGVGLAGLAHFALCLSWINVLIITGMMSSNLKIMFCLDVWLFPVGLEIQSLKLYLGHKLKLPGDSC